VTRPAVAAAVTATVRPAKPDGMRLRIGACCLPHPDKAHYGGEDAYFASAAGGGALGVADGVGGWAESGVNPAQYSRTLMRVACAYIEGAEGEELARAAADGASAATANNSLDGCYATGGDPEGYAYAFNNGVVAAAAVGGSSSSGRGRAYVDPRAALDAAHRRTRCAGSATACVLQLDGTKRRLVAANLVSPVACGSLCCLCGLGGACVLAAAARVALPPCRTNAATPQTNPTNQPHNPTSTPQPDPNYSKHSPPKGDSGFIVVRSASIIARSRPLQHFFDCPLQLGAYPEFVDATDTAAQAEVFEVSLQVGLGSLGVGACGGGEGGKWKGWVVGGQVVTILETRGVGPCFQEGWRLPTLI